MQLVGSQHPVMPLSQRTSERAGDRASRPLSHQSVRRQVQALRWQRYPALLLGEGNGGPVWGRRDLGQGCGPAGECRYDGVKGVTPATPRRRAGSRRCCDSGARACASRSKLVKRRQGEYT